jgi:DNA-directed RNA polymerase subunit RPC12/RpoP
MRGHIRRRGDPGSWEYIIDVGMAAAQRCQGCGKRFWMQRKPKPACPKCGGQLLETEERRRKTQAGFRSRKDAEVAMCKVMTAVEKHSYVVPTRITVREYLLREQGRLDAAQRRVGGVIGPLTLVYVVCAYFRARGEHRMLDEAIARPDRHAWIFVARLRTPQDPEEDLTNARGCDAGALACPSTQCCAKRHMIACAVGEQKANGVQTLCRACRRAAGRRPPLAADALSPPPPLPPQRRVPRGARLGSRNRLARARMA